MHSRSRLAWVLVALTAVGTRARVQADASCQFLQRGSTLYLQADCETSRTLLVPDGFVLDGRGFCVRAVEGAGESFGGAVVTNSGKTAHVRNLVIDAGDLRPICHPAAPDDTRLRAILLQGADGSIVGNRIVAINQGRSGCQEGAAIEVRADPSEAAPLRSVVISGNRIQHFQKTGIFVRGPLEVGIYLNQVQGEGPVDYIAQNGIQVTGSVRGSIKLNLVSDTIYTGSEVSATGILITETALPLEILLNHVDDTDVGVRLAQVSNSEVGGNTIRASTYDGIALDGRSGSARANRLIGNRVSDSGSVGIDLFGAGASHNLVLGNVVLGSGIAAIQEQLGAADNRIWPRAGGAGAEATSADVSTEQL